MRPSAIQDVVASMQPRTTGAMQILLNGAGPVVRPPMRVQLEYGPDEEDLEGCATRSSGPCATS